MAKRAAQSGQPKNMTVPMREGETPERAKVKAVLGPSLQGAVTLQQANAPTMGELDLLALSDELREQADEIRAGKLGKAEAMLMTQASTLDALFHGLTRKALAAEFMPQFEGYMRMALRAQSQARATVETLAEMKHPRPVLIARQANVTTGPQQVNNGVPADGSRTKQSENRPTELLGASDGERLDRGTTGAAGGSHPALATVDAIHRAENG